MPKSSRHMQGMVDSLVNHTNQQTADEFASKYPLSQSAAYEPKLLWAQNICQYLESNFEEETIKAIRMSCACGPSPDRMKKIRKLYSTSDSPEEFAEKYNRAVAGSTIWWKGDALFLSYPACTCPCVKRTDKPVSKTWCYCTLGYTKRLFDFVFDCDTDAELLETILSGGSRCLMKITKRRENQSHAL